VSALAGIVPAQAQQGPHRQAALRLCGQFFQWLALELQRAGARIVHQLLQGKVARSEGTVISLRVVAAAAAAENQWCGGFSLTLNESEEYQAIWWWAAGACHAWAAVQVCDASKAPLPASAPVKYCSTPLQGPNCLARERNMVQQPS
jgi:hypothetical protein